jgi:hypothetical protein
VTYKVSCNIPGVEDHTDLTVLHFEFHLLSEYFKYRHIKNRAEASGDTQAARVAESWIRSIERDMRDWTKQIAWEL